MTRRTLPLLAVALVLLLDGVAAVRSWGVPVVGGLDEPAHLLTAAVLLTAAGGRRVWTRTTFVLSALVGAVAIDLDHIPLYLGVPGVAVHGGRPFTHSLATAAVLAAAGLAVPRRRRLLLGLATGVLLHLVRDLGTGPGVPLLWPLSDMVVRVPYVAYAGVLAALATVAGARLAPTRAPLPAPRP